MGTSTISIDSRARTACSHETVRLHEAEHRHGNNLQILSNLVRRNLREAESQEAREVLSSVSELVETMVRLHKLSQDRERDLAVLLRGMGCQWQRLCNGHIRLEVEAEDGIEMAESSQTVAILIAQELVQNAIKHAFPGDHSGTIHVRLYANDGGKVTLEVEDDGIDTPLPDTPCACTPRGQALVRDLSVTLGGTLRLDQARGGTGHRTTVCWPR